MIPTTRVMVMMLATLGASHVAAAPPLDAVG